jgi:hypothetical protein
VNANCATMSKCPRHLSLLRCPPMRQPGSHNPKTQNVPIAFLGPPSGMGTKRGSIANFPENIEISMTFGGRGGIRTHEGAEPPAGFQDRCLKPLGHPSNYLICLYKSIRRQGQKNHVCYHFSTPSLRPPPLCAPERPKREGEHVGEGPRAAVQAAGRVPSQLTTAAPAHRPSSQMSCSRPGVPSRCQGSRPCLPDR